MKNSIQIVASLLLLIITISCEKNQHDSDDIYNIWEAKNFVSVESVAYSKEEDNTILLSIEESGDYQLQLDVNSCYGSIIKITKSEIELSTAGCTEICCDSEFSERLVQLLPQVETYSIVGGELHLFVPEWGYISFEKVRLE